MTIDDEPEDEQNETLVNSLLAKIMHGSIPAVTIPPRAIPPGFVFFLQECSKFPTPGTLKLDNSPPRGIATLYC
jgi:hypothetical protein